MGDPTSTMVDSISGLWSLRVEGEITFTVVPIGVITVVLIVAATIYVLHFAVSIVWTSRAVSVAPIIVTLTTIVFARRVIASATTRWRR